MKANRDMKTDGINEVVLITIFDCALTKLLRTIWLKDSFDKKYWFIVIFYYAVLFHIMRYKAKNVNTIYKIILPNTNEDLIDIKFITHFGICV